MVFDQLVSVIIITRNRPQMLLDCLEHVLRQDYEPFEIIVVDSSSNEESQTVLDDFPAVRRLRIPGGKNNMPQARNLGIEHAKGEIIAFIDDDSMVREGWLKRLMAAYSDLDIGAVGGRVIDEYEDSRAIPNEAVGMITDFRVVANFSLDTVCPLEVDHLRGCNMSFRRSILVNLGSFDSNYRGPNTLEDTDMCFRVKRAGYKVVFEPEAACDHLSVRWRGFQSRPPGLRLLLHGYENQAYFWFKHFGVNWGTFRHVFGGMPRFQVRVFLENRTVDALKRLVVVFPGGVLGLCLSVSSSLDR